MAPNYLVYVGTYTRRDSEGIYVYSMDGETGELTYSSKMTGLEDPSFLTVDPGQRFLYVTSEISEYEGEATGIVAAYAISRPSGEISLIGIRRTGGTIPCHVQVDNAARYLVLANYGSGSVTSFPIGDDGGLGEPVSFFQHEGSSVNPQRQQGPHAHSINLDAANRFAFAPDLGTDYVVAYRFEAGSGRLIPNEPASVAASPGAGPRHFDFHPNGRFAYAINELDSTVTAYDYDADEGTLAQIHTVSTLPDDFGGDTTCADVHVSPDGRFLYGSNRGHDSIRPLLRRPGDWAADGHRPYVDAWRDPAQLRYRPDGRVPARSQPGQRYDCHVQDRSGLRGPGAGLPRGPSPDADLRQVRPFRMIGHDLEAG